MLYEDVQDLPPETIELLRSVSGQSMLDETGVDEVMLAAFACGISTPEQEGITLSALISSREMRQRLKAMEAMLAEMRSVAYCQISDRRHSPVLAHCIRGAMQASMRVYCRSRRTCIDRGWAEISGSRDLESKSVRAIVGAIATSYQWILEERAPQSASAGSALDGFVSSARIDEDGALRVVGQIANTTSASQPPSLEFVDPNGGSLPLFVPKADLPFEAVVAGFAEMAGFVVGPIPTAIFSFGGPSVEAEPESRGCLFAPIESSREKVILKLAARPVVSREQLIVRLEAQPSQLAQCVGYNLHLLVPIGSIVQTVGIWPIADWNGCVTEFRCSLPGVVDGEVECGSTIQARLRKPHV
ncbi:MAG: hypothetical protein P4L46_17615 [Fimbriimonas sp.]|nr:hypothetical protein [Fimbriimonas sp.]